MHQRVLGHCSHPTETAEWAILGLLLSCTDPWVPGGKSRPMAFTGCHISSLRDIKPTMISSSSFLLEDDCSTECPGGGEGGTRGGKRFIWSPSSLSSSSPAMDDRFSSEASQEYRAYGLQDGRDPKQVQALGPRKRDERFVTPSR